MCLAPTHRCTILYTNYRRRPRCFRKRPTHFCNQNDGIHVRCSTEPCKETILHDGTCHNSVSFTPTENNIAAYQTSGSCCHAATVYTGHPVCEFDTSSGVKLAWELPVNEVIQIVVPALLTIRNLYLAHYPQITRHMERRRICDTTRQKSFWPHMANNTLVTASQ